MYFGTASCTLVPITSLAMAFTSGKALPTATLHEAARIMGMFVYPHQVEQVMSRFEEVKRWQIEVTNPGGIDEMTLFIETSGFKREEELLHQFREKIKLRPELKILAPGSLPPQIRPIEDKRHWD